MKRGVKVTVTGTWHTHYGKQGVIVGGVTDKFGTECLVALATGETITARDTELTETKKGKQ